MLSYRGPVRVACQPVNDLADAGHVEEVTEDRYPPQEVDGHREESTKQQDEAVRFDEHPDQREAKQDDQDAAEERDRRLDLVLLEKEPERALQTDHAGQPADEENISNGKQSLVEEQQDSQEQEGHPKSGQTDTDFLSITNFKHFEL